MLAQHMIYWQMVGSISLRWPDNVPIRLALCRRCFIIGPILGRHHQRTPHRYHVGPVIVIRWPYSGAISDEVGENWHNVGPLHEIIIGSMLAHVDHTHIPVLVPPRWACDSYSLAL